MDYSEYFKKIQNLTGNDLLRFIYGDKKVINRLSGKISEPDGTFYPVGVSHDFWNAYIYGDELKIVYIKNGVIHRKEKRTVTKSTAPKNDKDKEERFRQSLSRTKSKIFELAACNEFKYFCTFTLDKEKYNRYDLTKFRKDLAQYIRNLNRNRKEKIFYLSIPEPHKDGAWHIHSLIGGLTDKELTAFKVSDKIPKRLKTAIKNGTTIYNWAAIQKRFGYFTATAINDKQATSKYVTKYITKELQDQMRKAGEHLFFSSQGLKGREVVAIHSFDPPPFDSWDFENEYCKIKTVPLSQNTDSKN